MCYPIFNFIICLLNIKLPLPPLPHDHKRHSAVSITTGQLHQLLRHCVNDPKAKIDAWCVVGSSKILTPPPPPTLLCYCRWRASTWSRRPTSWSLSSIAAGSFLNRLLRWAESFWINFMSFLYKQFLLSYVVRGKVDSIDEGFIQKQRSALLFGGQNWFNSLPQYRFCARMIWRNGHGWIEKWTLGGMDASEQLDDLPVHTTPNHHPPKVDVFPKKNSSNHPSC